MLLFFCVSVVGFERFSLCLLFLDFTGLGLLLEDRYIMSHLSGEDRELKTSFKWGVMKGVGRVNKDVQFYESFTWGGMHYSLYDSVYFYRPGECDTSIGKLVKMYEVPGHDKKVKIVWFFRPAEIRNYLGDYEPRWNELFLGSGEGPGLSNLNLMETIIGKCSTVCTSNDQRNSQPSEADLMSADFVFCRTFDVGKFAISEKFPDKIAGIEVEHYFNMKKDQKLIKPPQPENVQELNGKSSSFANLEVDKMVRSAVKDGVCGSKLNPEVKESKNAAIISSDERHFPNENSSLRLNVRLLEDCLAGSKVDVRPPKKRKFFMEEKEGKISDKKAFQSAQASGTKTVRRFGEDRRSWFKELPWEERLQNAHKEGSLVLFKNLDPDFTSSEVENLVLRAFKETVEAKMIRRSPFSIPHCGEALVLFKSKDAADRALRKLRSGSLMLGDRRIVVGEEAALREPGKEFRFPGHLDLKNITRPQRQREDMRTAASTSHCSQPNTLEYDMAMEWRILQEKSELWWKALCKQQRKEIQALTSKLRMKRNL